MTFEVVTYADLAERLQCAQEAARALAKRLQLRRWLGGCYVAIDDLRLTPFSGGGLETDRQTTTQARLACLQREGC